MAYGAYVHRVTVEHAGTPLPNADGGYTDVWVPAVPPDWYCSIDPVAASPADLERVKSGTVVSQAAYEIRGHYRADITTRSRLTTAGRVFAVVGVSLPALRPIALELAAVEVVP